MPPSPFIILGLDPGFARFGYGVIEVAGSQKNVRDYGVIQTTKSQNFPARLETIFQELEMIIQRENPSLIGVEQIYFYQNTTTAIHVSHVRGVALLAAQRAHCPTIDVTPLQVKSTVAGFGKATKKQIQEMMRLELRLQKIPQPDDAADALAIALTAGILYRSSHAYVTT